MLYFGIVSKNSCAIIFIEYFHVILKGMWCALKTVVALKRQSVCCSGLKNRLQLLRYLKFNRTLKKLMGTWIAMTVQSYLSIDFWVPEATGHCSLTEINPFNDNLFRQILRSKGKVYYKLE